MNAAREKARRDDRMDRNRDLVARMRRGEPDWNFNAAMSFFPPRPVIKKDPEAVKRLFGGNP